MSEVDLGRSIDATLLGIIYHPKLRDIFPREAQGDLRKFLEDLVNTVTKNLISELETLRGENARLRELCEKQGEYISVIERHFGNAPITREQADKEIQLRARIAELRGTINEKEKG